MNTILITGANRGLGLELTKQFSADNWRVFACCRNPTKAKELQSLKTANSNIQIYPLDVTDNANIQGLAESLNRETIDILFNNAGIIGADEVTGNIQSEHLLEVLETNTVAPVMVAQAFMQHLLNGNKKIIANMSSVMGSIEQTTADDHFSYRISKAALNEATRCMAMGLNAKQITVVSFHPGWVQTDMGGSSAPINPAISITGIKKVLDHLSIKDTGQFISYDGKHLLW